MPWPRLDVHPGYNLGVCLRKEVRLSDPWIRSIITSNCEVGVCVHEKQSSDPAGAWKWDTVTGAKLCLSNQKNFLVLNWSPCFHWDQWSLCLQDQQVSPARGCRLQSVAGKPAISRMCWPTKHSSCIGCLLGTPGNSHFAELLETLHMENIPHKAAELPCYA